MNTPFTLDLPSSVMSTPLRPDGLGPDSPSGSHRFRHNPAFRAVLLAVLVLGAMQLFAAVPTLSGWSDSWVIAFAVAGAVTGYLIVARGFEGRRPLVELDPGRWTGLLWGLALGAVLFTVCFGILLLTGGYRIIGIDTAGPWLVPALSLGLMAGVTEEILLRAGLHRLVEQGLGTWASAGVSGVVFGLLHPPTPTAASGEPSPSRWRQDCRSRCCTR